MKLHVKNFGPIRDAKVEIRPMTVLVGHSNTGKSYLAMLVYCVAKAFGIVNSRESFLSVFSNNLTRSYITTKNPHTTLVSEIDRGNFIDQHSVRVIVDRVVTAYFKHIKEAWERKVSFCFGTEWRKTARLDKQADFSLLITDETGEMTFDLLSDAFAYTVPDIYVEEITEKLETILKEILKEKRAAASEMERELGMGFFSDQSLMSDGILTEIYDNNSPLSILNIIFGALNFFPSRSDDSLDERAQDRIHYLPAGRGTIMENHLAIVNAAIHNASAAPSNNSSYNGVTADFLQKLVSIRGLLNISDEGKKIAIFADRMEKRIAKGRIKLRISETGYPYFTYAFENVGAGDIPLTVASSAVSELASIVLFIRYYLSQGDMFIIEEPEANLHTAAQREIAALLVELVNAGMYVLITTHSDVILEQISNCMQASRLPEDSKTKVLHDAKLAPEKINAYTFVENNDGTEVELISPDEEDLDILSEDHTDVSSDLYNESVRIYNSIQENDN